MDEEITDLKVMSYQFKCAMWILDPCSLITETRGYAYLSEF